MAFAIFIAHGRGAAAPDHAIPTALMPQLPTRDDALALMHQHVRSESLRRHMYSVEAACRAYARRWGEDEEPYGLAGLLHDYDYE